MSHNKNTCQICAEREKTKPLSLEQRVRMLEITVRKMRLREIYEKRQSGTN